MADTYEFKVSVKTAHGSRMGFVKRTAASQAEAEQSVREEWGPQATIQFLKVVVEHTGEGAMHPFPSRSKFNPENGPSVVR